MIAQLPEVTVTKKDGHYTASATYDDGSIVSKRASTRYDAVRALAKAMSKIRGNHKNGDGHIGPCA